MSQHYIATQDRKQHCTHLYRKHMLLLLQKPYSSRVLYQIGPPKMFIVDEDRTLSTDVSMHIYNTLNIRSQLTSPVNHGSLKT